MGCGGTGNSHHGRVANQSAATVRYNHVNVGEKKSLRNIFKHLLESMIRNVNGV